MILIRDRDLRILLALIVGAAFALHLGSAAAGHSFYRDIHLGTALEYAKGSVDLFSPVIVGFNANGMPTPQELPLWQALAGLVMKIGGGWFGWANLVSLLIFCSSLWPVFRLARRFLRDDRAAWWVVVFFASQPLIVVHAGLASTDILCLAFAVWFLDCATSALDSGAARSWIAAAVTGALCAVSKAPFFLAAGLALFLLLVVEHRRSSSRWAGLAGVGIFGAAAFGLWTRHADSCLAAAEFPYLDLRVSENPYMAEWYFGTLEKRLDPAIYLKSGWRFMSAIAGSFALVALPLLGLCMRGAKFAWVLLLAGVLTTMVFFNLVTIHRHYYLIFSPGMAIAAGLGAFRLEALWRARAGAAGLSRLAAAGTVPFAGMILFLSLGQGLIGMEVVGFYDGYGKRVAKLIAEHTREEDRLLVCGGSWGGNELILSRRQGLSLRDPGVLDDEAARRRLRELGYGKLVCLSESPLLHALQMTNPGGAGRGRVSWRTFRAESAKDWPEVFSSEDVLIVEIP